MQLSDKVIVVTGGAGGIGAALCRRFAAEGARGVVVADRDADGARRVAAEIGGLAVAADVAVEADVVRLVERATADFGPIDLFCSNAGIATDGGVERPDAEWQRIWDVNVMAHVYAARAVLPGMLARGEGYLLQTASAAGLLTQIGSAPYAVTKHAAVALAEWLAITYGDAGIKVSCLCPLGVETEMLRRAPGGIGDHAPRRRAMTPEAVADAVVAGLAEERFLILPHPEVAEYFRRKADDYDRWLRGMRRLQEKFGGRHERPGAGAARPGLVLRRRLRPALAGRRGAGAAARRLLGAPGRGLRRGLRRAAAAAAADRRSGRRRVPVEPVCPGPSRSSCRSSTNTTSRPPRPTRPRPRPPGPRLRASWSAAYRRSAGEDERARSFQRMFEILLTHWQTAPADESQTRSKAGRPSATASARAGADHRAAGARAAGGGLHLRRLHRHRGGPGARRARPDLPWS